MAAHVQPRCWSRLESLFILPAFILFPRWRFHGCCLLHTVVCEIPPLISFRHFLFIFFTFT